MAQSKFPKEKFAAGMVVRVPDVGSHAREWPVIEHPQGGPGRWGMYHRTKGGYHRVQMLAKVGFVHGEVQVMGDLQSIARVREIAQHRYDSAMLAYRLAVASGVYGVHQPVEPVKPSWL